MASIPQFAVTPKRNGCTWKSTTTANTKNDGTGTIGTDILLAFTAGSSGSFIERIRLHPVGSTAATATTATVGRIYFSTQASGATTNDNTRLWQEVACPAQTTDQTTTATVPIDIPVGIRIAASDTILFSMHHAAAANTSWEVTVIAADL
jgi:hypothetical protein